jgi:uncharacterized protein YkwD
MIHCRPSVPPAQLSLILAVILTTLLTSSAQPAEAATRRVRAEQLLTEQVNTARKRHDLRPLRVKVQVRRVAREWSGRMATRNDLAHNPRYATQITGGWRRVGENVGYIGGTDASVRQLVGGVHRMLMHSPGHRANILGRYNRVGIGARFDDAGRLWVTQNFARF